MKDYLRYTGVLLIITMIAAGALGGIYKVTEPNIKAQESKEKADALKVIFGDFDDNRTEEVKDKDGKLLYRKLYNDSGEFIGVTFEVIAGGFSSNIKTTVGMEADGTIIGIKVTSQAETPGLGARMDEIKTSKYLWTFWKEDDEAGPEIPSFQYDFYNKKYHKLYLEKSGGIDPESHEIEAITGATISSKAVLDSVISGCKQVHDHLNKAGVE